MEETQCFQGINLVEVLETLGFLLPVKSSGIGMNWNLLQKICFLETPMFKGLCQASAHLPKANPAWADVQEWRITYENEAQKTFFYRIGCRHRNFSGNSGVYQPVWKRKKYM